MTTPSIGRIVHYKLNNGDAAAINRRIHDASQSIAKHQSDADGSIIHVGNGVAEGDVYPAMIVRTWTLEPNEVSPVQLQVFIDGNHTYWATSRIQGDLVGQYSFPVVARVSN